MIHHPNAVSWQHALPVRARLSNRCTASALEPHLIANAYSNQEAPPKGRGSVFPALVLKHLSLTFRENAIRSMRDSFPCMRSLMRFAQLARVGQVPDLPGASPEASEYSGGENAPDCSVTRLEYAKSTPPSSPNCVQFGLLGLMLINRQIATTLVQAGHAD